MEIQVETITLHDGSRMEAIRDIEAVRRLVAESKFFRSFITEEDDFYEEGPCFEFDHERLVDELCNAQSIQQWQEDFNDEQKIIEAGIRGAIR